MKLAAAAARAGRARARAACPARRTCPNSAPWHLRHGEAARERLGRRRSGRWRAGRQAAIGGGRGWGGREDGAGAGADGARRMAGRPAGLRAPLVPSMKTTTCGANSSAPPSILEERSAREHSARRAGLVVLSSNGHVVAFTSYGFVPTRFTLVSLSGGRSSDRGSRQPAGMPLAHAERPMMPGVGGRWQGCVIVKGSARVCAVRLGERAACGAHQSCARRSSAQAARRVGTGSFPCTMHPAVGTGAQVGSARESA